MNTQIRLLLFNVHSSLYLPLPKLTADQERIILVRLAHPESNELNFEEFTKMTFAITEFFLKYDYAKGLRVVADFKGVRLEHITKINASLMQKIVSATQDALANRVLGIDLFSTPSYVNILLGILKRVMKPKLFERVSFSLLGEWLFQCLVADSNS